MMMRAARRLHPMTMKTIYPPHLWRIRHLSKKILALQMVSDSGDIMGSAVGDVDSWARRVETWPAVRVWDAKVGSQIPAFNAEWQPRWRSILDVDSSEMEKFT
ncbi:hypothetical protein NE237_006348 [Protea cynaroides]|uniref:Uncharacterized protein n=1 Tax=Protea cynaroides TaxID=273540 RepID=A0A9Q0KME9_9MAGN|nr:hypothetical protein NE237_006348 [Protea cynaroides]